MLQHGVEHFPRVALFWRLSHAEPADAGPRGRLEVTKRKRREGFVRCRCDADLPCVAAECCRDAHPREERAWSLRS